MGDDQMDLFLLEDIKMIILAGGETDLHVVCVSEAVMCFN